MNDKKIIKTIEKHISNGHGVEKLRAWWLRLFGDTAELSDQTVTFYVTTVSGKRRAVYSRSTW